MDGIRAARHLEKLNKRKAQVLMTLRHVEKQQREAESNTDWLDQAAYKSRIDLLDRLSEWYATELDQIDKALERIAKNQYGECLACHVPIEPSRLDLFPETAFCTSCQDTREALESV